MKRKSLHALLMFFLLSCIAYSQDSHSIISGVVLSDTLSVENIHVFNVSSKIGVVSNIDGKFEIEAQVSDTLLISGIQFQEERIVITNDILEKIQLNVQLKESSYAMDEVMLQNELSGNLEYDVNRKKNEKEVISEYALDFSAKNFPDSRTLVDEDSRMKTSNDSEVGGGRGSGLFYIAGLILSPITKPIGKLIKNNQDEKMANQVYNQSLIDAVDNDIRKSLGDEFFTNDMKIPKEHINLFIEFCASKNIGELFANEKQLEMIDVFLVESETYKKMNKL